MTATAYPHIQVDEKGVPHVAGTGVKVIEIALARLAWNWDAEQIQRNHPHLTLGKVHAALGYYYDHQGELDQDIARREGLVEEFFANLPPSPIRAKLKAASPPR
jgi:uncharacterized protein (DUF433 family)